MPQLDVYTFGKRLLDTNDLDPIYVMLWKARLDPLYLKHWLLGYWCFYHSGTASWLVDADEDGDYYWDRFKAAANSKEYPRCRERRHYRGENARKSAEFLQSRGLDSLFGTLEDAELDNGGFLLLADVLKYVQTWVGFGPWIAFKVADMLERLQLCNVKFDANAFYESPAEGAEEAWNRFGKGEKPENVVAWAVDSILSRLGLSGPVGNGRRVYLAPPRLERPINVQEAETILCKWKSYLGGHYKIGEDVHSLRESLNFRTGRTAKQLIEAGKKASLWNA